MLNKGIGVMIMIANMFDPEWVWEEAYKRMYLLLFFT